MKTLEEALKEECDTCERNKSDACPYQYDFPNDCPRRTSVAIEYTDLDLHSHSVIYGRML